MSDLEATLKISSTWDGDALSSAETALVRLRLDDRLLRFEISAPFHHDPEPPDPVGTLDGLWEYEVVEFFVADEAGESYTEVEISPWGHSLGLRFSNPRVRLPEEVDIDLETRRDEHTWTAAGSIGRRFLPSAPTRGNAFAIHGSGGRRRYLAAYPLATPAPDFHRPDDFPRIFAATRPARDGS